MAPLQSWQCQSRLYKNEDEPEDWGFFLKKDILASYYGDACYELMNATQVSSKVMVWTFLS
jgi:hypothetical protein